ncbi:glycosyltransferase family 4 protein [Syntrophus aciditrophicus]|uniref:glycosyltransferase family 4 protein n=1 Tax=Syntrophus aciditrophicus TaxID=316277 RepID=UPI0002FCACE7|nr:glycosyltransferase family 4 protein [Syntrophus aciditrophicus]
MPVFDVLNRMTNGELHVIYGKEVTPCRVQKKISAVLGSQGIGLEGEKRIGPKVLSGYANETLRIVYQPGALSALKRIKPDVVVGDGFFQWTAFALAYRILYGIPLVVCYERTAYTERKAQWYRSVYRNLVLKFVGAMSCNGKLSKEYAQSLGMDSRRITTGHMVADTDNLKQRTAEISNAQCQDLRASWGAPKMVFLSVGRLVALKGFSHLLEGWSKFSGAYDGTSALVIVGSGPEYAALHELIKRMTLKSVHLVGDVDYDQIATYYASADIFVMPTLEDNWSLVVPEAMACGLPVICSIYNGCWPELVQEGRNGWVFDPLQRDSIVRTLTKALSSVDDLPRMGSESRSIVANHTPEHAAKAIWDACKIALGTKHL